MAFVCDEKSGQINEGRNRVGYAEELVESELKSYVTQDAEAISKLFYDVPLVFLMSESYI